MRYLRTRNHFITAKNEVYHLPSKNSMITEANDGAFENDITWGGSLIGRLINSTIRVVKIRYNESRVNRLLVELKEMLYTLLEEVSSLSEKDNARLIRAKLLIYHLWEVSTDTENELELRIRVLLSKEDYATRQSAATAAPGPVNASASYGGQGMILEAEETPATTTDTPTNAEEAQKEARRTAPVELGMIDLVIKEVKEVELEGKEELLKKLERFKQLVMDIPLEGESGGDQEDNEQQEREEEKKDLRPKFEFYNATKGLLAANLDLLRQIKDNSVKQFTSFKKGDMCMWQQEKTDRTLFAMVEEDYDGGDSIRLRYKDENGRSRTFSISIRRVKALTYFDDAKYKRMSEQGRKAIEKKLFFARVGFYTYLNRKDRRKSQEYKAEIERLEELVTRQGQETAVAGSPATTSGGKKGGEVAKNESVTNDVMLFEEADVLIKDKTHQAVWSYIVDAYEDLRKDEGSFKRSVQMLGDLVAGKYEGKSDKKQVISVTVDLGKEVMRLLKDKYKPVSIEDMKKHTKDTSTKLVRTSAESPYGRHMLISEAQTLPGDSGSGNNQTATTSNLPAKRTLDKDVADCADMVARFARVILSLKQDMDIAKAYSTENGDGASKSILKMISSYDKMKESRESMNESGGIMTSFGEYMLLREADQGDEGDLDNFDYGQSEGEGESEEGQVQGQIQGQGQGQAEDEDTDLLYRAWYTVFEKGEEKDWFVEESEVKEPMGPEKGKVVIRVGPEGASDPKLDPIIRIVRIFGRAYKLYATPVIPSGRPEGRVSQRTFREYEYIGSGDSPNIGKGSPDSMTPGYGPWAAKRVYDKWQDGVMELLEDKWLRRVLANVQFVSAAENETEMQQKKQKPERSSGITLLRFITDLINLEGNFEKARKKLMLKYFNADLDPNNGHDEKTEDDNKNKNKIDKENRLPSDEPFFMGYTDILETKVGKTPLKGSDFIKGGIRKGVFYSVVFRDGGVAKHLTLLCVYKDKDLVIFKAHSNPSEKRRESMLSSRLPKNSPVLKLKRIQEVNELNGIGPLPEQEVLLIAIKSDQFQNFKNDGVIKILNTGNLNGDVSDIKGIAQKELTIKKIGVLVRNDGSGGFVVDTFGDSDRARLEPNLREMGSIKTKFINFTPAP
jgi:hypothetical protein